MGARNLSRALIWLVALSGPAVAVQAGDPLLEKHLRNVYLERRLAFHTAWADADAAARASVRSLFDERLKKGVPAVYGVSVELLTRSWRALGGAEPTGEGLEFEQRLADTLDLRVQPGAFEASDAERGGSMVVRVLPLQRTSFGSMQFDEVDLTLVWLGPEGQEVRARSEPIHASAFVLPGFEMYIFSPPSRGGIWRLVPEVTSPRGSARGVPVEVECVLNLFDRFDVAEGIEPRSEEGAALRSALMERVRHGVRDATRPGVSALLAWDEIDVSPPRALTEEIGGGVSYELPLPEGSEPRHAILIACPRLEDPLWELANETGAGWRELAATGRFRVIATGLAALVTDGPSLLSLANDLRREDPSLEVTVLIRGAAVGRLRIALASQESPFDRVVLNTVIVGDRTPKALFPVPTFVLETLDQDAEPARVDTGESRPELVWYRRSAPPSIAERDLPAQLAAWLAGDGR